MITHGRMGVHWMERMGDRGAEEDARSAATRVSSLAHWITRLGLIPDEARRFDVDPNRAKLEFGVDVNLAQDLIAQGLPHRVSDGDPCFTVTDLHYVGLRLGCARTYLGVLQTWASSLTASAGGQSMSVEVRCPPDTPRGTAVDVLTGPDQHIRASVGASRVAASIHVVPTVSWPMFGSAAEKLLVDAASLDFCWIPEALNGDVEFTRRTRLSDCRNAALLLSRECAHLGIVARMAYGLLLATPFSTPHTWVEIRVGDRWVPADPLLVRLLAEHAALDSSVWPPIRSPGAVLLRLAERETAIVLTEGRPLQASFLTRSV
jgi:hypothetical protein